MKLYNRGEDMKITSMDISNKEFKKVIRGYSSDEVDEFLEKISEDYEVLYKENSSLKEKGFTLNEKLEHFSKMEETIHNTLVLAQSSAEQAKLSAQKEAELIIRNANDSSKRIVDKAHNDILQINDEYDKIKQDFIKFRAKFRNFMNAQLETFNDLENDLVKNYNVGLAVEEKSIERITNEDKLFDFNENNEWDGKAKDIKNEVFNNSLDEIKSFFTKD
jgi:cell division initiation protein